MILNHIGKCLQLVNYPVGVVIKTPHQNVALRKFGRRMILPLIMKFDRTARNKRAEIIIGPAT